MIRFQSIFFAEQICFQTGSQLLFCILKEQNIRNTKLNQPTDVIIHCVNNNLLMEERPCLCLGGRVNADHMLMLMKNTIWGCGVGGGVGWGGVG
jgi:hypothetical protein